MSDEVDKKNNIYNKLTPQRKQLIDDVLKNLENGTSLWKQGWRMSGVPESATTGKKYQGINNIFLTMVSLSKKYSDNRWATFKQIESQGWRFKTDEEGNSLGKGAGVTIEYFEFRDKLTKKPFTRSTFNGLTSEEQDEYWKENVVPIRKYYRVFNGDVIEGIPQKEKKELNPNSISDRVENIISVWSETESKIHYGGGKAYYTPSTDEIFIPSRDDFYSMQEFYSTVLHEIGHSTGHEKRMKRDLTGFFGSPEYAIEELRAEIASMFIGQDLDVSVEENHIQNNSAYIKHWYSSIKDNPNILFSAISDADKIAKLVIKKEKVVKKNIEYYAIVEDENSYGELGYKVYMATEYGLAPAINYSFTSKEALMSEFEKMQTLPFWMNSQFQAVSKDDLEAISFEKTKELTIITPPSDVYIKPSEVAEKTIKNYSTVDMSQRGIESLAKMSDRDVIERASQTKDKEKFQRLYDGESVLGSKEKDQRSLMVRLAMFCNQDQEQLLRVFQSSGQYHNEKPASFYQEMAERSLKFIFQIRNKNILFKPSSKERQVMNIKS